MTSWRSGRWWVQSFLAGIPTMIIGGRNEEGVLKEVHLLDVCWMMRSNRPFWKREACRPLLPLCSQIIRMPVASLPSRAKAAGQGFDAWQLLRFGDAVLSWMVEHGRGRPGQHLRFHYKPKDESISCSVVPDGPLPGRLQNVLSSQG